MSNGADEKYIDRKYGVYSVEKYSKHQFIKLLADHSKANEACIRKKRITVYLIQFLKKLGTASIIIEEKYFDRHFLADYTASYSRAFFDYERSCVRLHFLSIPFEDKDLSIYLNGKATPEDFKTLEKNYNGFIIIRTLRDAVIGRTCLKPIKENLDSFTCTYPEKRKYHAHIFGQELSVETVAFQEQDRAAAACATAALWSVFSVTGKLYHHAIPTPVEITQSAVRNIIGKTKSVPKHGLTIEQMLQVTRDVGLDALTFKTDIKVPKIQSLLKAYVYAFISGGIPLIITAALHKEQKKDNEENNNVSGRHAIAITGFKLAKSELKKMRNSKNDIFKLKSSAIHSLCVHDDQVGPFAEMQFKDDYLTTLWSDYPVARPIDLLVPLPVIVRMPIQDILRSARQLDEYIKGVQKYTECGVLLPKQLVWDISITEGYKFKELILGNDHLKEDIKRHLLKLPVPCNIWRAIGYCDDVEVIEIASDATDFGQRHECPKIIPYNKNFVKTLVMILTCDHISKFKGFKKFLSKFDTCLLDGLMETGKLLGVVNDIDPST